MSSKEKEKKKKLLRAFQCETTRSAEEDFARLLSDDAYVRLFFINENQAYTDGARIVVDPAFDDMYCDLRALQQTEDWLGIEHLYSGDEWLALRMITRAQSVHESLHIIYTDFPIPVMRDSRATTPVRAQVLSLIDNIIEDAFIEAAGCSEYDNMELFLKFGRVSRLFSNTPSDGTVQRAFSELPEIGQDTRTDAQIKAQQLATLLDYAATILLYPMVRPEKLAPELDSCRVATMPLFQEGSLQGVCADRFEYAQRIFDAIEDLIPDVDEPLSLPRIAAILPGMRTHSGDIPAPDGQVHKGRKGNVARRLFADLDGNFIQGSQIAKKAHDIFNEFIDERDGIIELMSIGPQVTVFKPNQLGAAACHKGVNVEVIKPAIDMRMKPAYDDMAQQLHVSINAGNAQFTQLLQASEMTEEDRYMFGSKISSRRLGDVRKRFWIRSVPGLKIPDLAILFMIDGSGSMSGARIDAARRSSIVLHEVLAQHNVEHAIVEHRAIFDEPTVQHTLLVDFSGRPEQKYNIMGMDTGDGTREGLSLLWAQRYLQTASAERKLIVAISDGQPCHFFGENDYTPPLSVADTACVARKLIRSGISIVAIALADNDDEAGWSCYDQLKEIYPSVIECNDLAQLPSKVFRTITHELRR
ncbi:MAG: VWA domain-containing protein [Eggerthellaceae bacterium]|jgi:hypothetical protein|nr:VWA domain-containing protein [Eggerthellaceae bacterium]MCH4221345.1 VWA domain-containing protein [Eggerthellaceae bacterium]